MASLNLAESEQILAAAKDKVREMGTKMSISVVDPRGDLIAMVRTDGASWRTPLLSKAKAAAASCFERSTGDLMQNADQPIFIGFMTIEGGHMIPHRGALPVFRAGELIGAVGASGGSGSGQQDEDLCKAVLEAVGFSTAP